MPNLRVFCNIMINMETLPAVPELTTFTFTSHDFPAETPKPPRRALFSIRTSPWFSRTKAFSRGTFRGSLRYRLLLNVSLPRRRIPRIRREHQRVAVRRSFPPAAAAAAHVLEITSSTAGGGRGPAGRVLRDNDHETDLRRTLRRTSGAITITTGTTTATDEG